MVVKYPKIIILIWAAVLVGIFEFFALSGISLPKLYAIPFYSLIILAIGHKTLYEGFQALLHFDFGSINLLMLIAVCGAFYLGEYPEAAVVIVLFTLAEHLEDLGIQKSQSAFDNLLQQMPKEVLVNGKKVSLDAVMVGQDYQVKPGEMIPLDGRVVEGYSLVDESTITGEPLPKDKREGDLVFAGTLNRQGILKIEVTKEADGSLIATIKKQTFEALQHKSQAQKFIEKFSRYYTPFVIALAVGWMLLALCTGRPFAAAFAEALALLVIACPCALVIATPISIYSALGNASAKGALIKGGRYLEAIGSIKAMALDKTRTLTYGNPVVTDVIPFEGHSTEHLLSCAAGIEQLSEHPLAASIVEAARSRNYKPHKVENFESIFGKGAKADCLVCEDKRHSIGKLQFILEDHKVPDDVMNKIDSLQNEGKTVIVISTDKHVEGIIALSDEIRPESKQFIEELDRLKITPVMLTGDQEAPARFIANQIGLQEVKANLLPQDKATAVKELLAKYKSVGMVGDGVNDAPALALSTVGISMSGLGSDTAQETASIVIMNKFLDVIPYLVRLGKKTVQTIQINTGFAIAVKALFIALALLGKSNLAMAIFADVGVTVLVILYSLRLLHWKPA